MSAMSPVLRRWTGALVGHGVAPGSTSLLVSYVVSLTSQALYFTLIARALGPAQFGTFAALLALSVFAGNFAGVGAGNVLVLSVSRGADAYPRCLGAALTLIPVTGLPLMLGTLVAVNLWDPSMASSALLLSLIHI